MRNLIQRSESQGNSRPRTPKRRGASRQAPAQPLAVRPLLDQAILGQLPLAVVIIRAVDYRVVLANPAAHDLFALERIEGTRVSQLQRSIADEGQRKAASRTEHPLVRAVVQRRELREEPLQLTRHDGQRLELLVNALPLYSRSGDVVGAMGVFQNVTRLRFLERMREDVLAVASHEIRGALTSLKGWADYAERKAQDASDPAATVRATAQVSSQITRFSGMVQQLLDLSLVDEIDTVAAEVVDMRAVVDSAVGSLAMDVAARVEVRRKSSVRALGDRQRLESVVRNLIANALKYSDADSPVTIRLLQNDKWVLLMVIDHGIGIPADDLAHIFNRFFRASNSHSKAGSGLGLYICRRIVEQLGGVMCVRSHEGRGSIIGFALPK